MGLFNLLRPAAPLLVVDVVALHESLGMKGNIAPRNQLQTFRRLARFAQREKLELVAVSSGAPLNKAPAGKKFDGMVVLYSKSADDHPKFLARTARAKGAGAVLVSGNSAAEKLLGAGGKKMRMSTFRKAFDTGTGEQEQADRPAGGGRGNRPVRRNRQKPAQKETKVERPPREMSEADAINELIDLVD